MGDRRFPSLCRGGDIEGVQAALDSGTNVNEEDFWGVTGLMKALIFSCLETEGSVVAEQSCHDHLNGTLILSPQVGVTVV